MNRPLRARHRWMILVVAVTVGLLSILGIRARREMPTMDDLPGRESTLESAADASK